MASSQTTVTPIYSTLTDDPDFGELVELFVAEMPDRITDLQSMFDTGDRIGVQRAAHQLRGAGGSYGFSQLTTFAATLEQSLSKNQPENMILQAFRN